MTGYKVITIDDLYNALGEDGLETVLSSYSCPLNADIEDFLLHKALDFSHQGLAKTHLVFASYQGKLKLAGYFALAFKTLFIPDKAKFSSSLKKRIKRFATTIPETRMMIISAPLIAQLGKNFNIETSNIITGDELLKMACDEIKKIQSSIGGKVAYLECEDTPKLISFYEENGFRRFSERVDGEKTHLVQMIRYFSE